MGASHWRKELVISLVPVIRFAWQLGHLGLRLKDLVRDFQWRSFKRKYA